MTDQTLTYTQYEHARQRLIDLHHTSPHEYLKAIQTTTPTQAHALLWYIIQDFDHLATAHRELITNPTD